ncbi:MAG TPA: lytic murein transglycosylase [Patescibacteria group bacterium]|nr:lytic murein transglycosylase [Patescibacteria group bacterium]
MVNKNQATARIFLAVILILPLVILLFPSRVLASESAWGEFVKSTRDKLRETEEEIMKKRPYEKIEKDNDNKNKNDNEKKDDDKKKKEEKDKDKNKKDKSPEEIKEIKEIEKHAQFASEKTGVNKDFLMGMLVVESAAGQNVGQCDYGEVEQDAQKSHDEGLLSEKAWQTFLDRKKTIENLAGELGYNPKEMKVSCNPAKYVGTGGAMGPGQFMPDTWLEYKDRVAEVVGKKTPDPWNARDSIVAMALKVSDVPGVKEKDVLCEKKASKLYLSGTTSLEYDWYANEIQYWKNNYHQLIAEVG